MDRRHPVPARLVACITLTLLVGVAPIANAQESKSESKPGSLALLPLVVSGLALDQLSDVDVTIQREVDSRFGPRSLSAALVRDRLEAGAKKGLRCDRSQESCQAQLGIVCDVDLVLIAAMGPHPHPGEPGAPGAPGTGDDAAAVGGGYTLTLRLVDVVEASQIAAASTTLAGLPTAADVRKLLGKLDTPEARKAIVVVTGPSGAPVLVDGDAKGSLPLPAALEVKPGKHEVTVHLGAGLEPYSVTVVARSGERVEVRAPGAPGTPGTPGTPAGTPGVPGAPAPPGRVSGPAGLANANGSAGNTGGSGAPLAPEPEPREPLEPPSPRLLSLVGGGVLVGVGAIATVVGLVPWLAAAESAGRLRDFDNAARTSDTFVDERAATIEETYTVYEDNRNAWNSWGQVVAGTGGAALLVGATIVTVGVVALEE